MRKAILVVIIGISPFYFCAWSIDKENGSDKVAFGGKFENRFSVRVALRKDRPSFAENPQRLVNEIECY